MNSDLDEFLEHYGVKGMRWGVRKSRSSREKTQYSKPPKKLTDEELTKRVKRLETEQRYNQLNSRTVGQGERLVTEILQSSGRKVATTVVTNAGMLAVGALISSRMGSSTGAAVVRRLK